MRDIPTAIPGQYALQIAVMKEMGWSQADYDAADAELVDEIETRLNAQGHWHAERRRMDARRTER